MHSAEYEDHRQRVLRFWWMIELFSPQQVPKVTPRAPRTLDRQVIEWRWGTPLPWETLPPPAALGGTRRVWQHTVFLGVYDLEATYESLHRAFYDDQDAYDERRAGRSACAGLILDANGVWVPDAAVLSSALWAVGRIETLSVRGRSWADGFPETAKAFIASVDEREGLRRESAGLETAPAQDEQSLLGILRTAQRLAAVTGEPRLATDGIVIQSVAVSAQRGEEVNDSDFLNSFFLEDLALVGARSGEHCGRALAGYLTAESALDVRLRLDVIEGRDDVDDGVKVERLPKGRWPADPAHGLALRQQFAVNHALNDLVSRPGLMGVNGPPGTGKTTMLRDIVAGNVVERARRLGALSQPSNAFTQVIHRWTAADGHRRSVPQLRPELTGFEMVVASANNAAVENVATEIPSRSAIHSRFEEADYFAEIATAVLAEVDVGATDEPRIDAWGLVAARLGNKRNRSAFHSAFWFDKKDPRTKEPVPGSPPRMQTVLTQWRDGRRPHRSWSEARSAFARAEDAVDALLAEREQMQTRWTQLPSAIDVERSWVDHLARLRSERSRIDEQIAHGRVAVDQQHRASARSLDARERHARTKPGFLETLFTFGRASRVWRDDLRDLDEQVRRDHAAQAQVEEPLGASERRWEEIAHQVVEAEEGLGCASGFLTTLRSRLSEDQARLKQAYPDESWVDEARELHAPWIDAELDAARSELFLAALRLHEDFLANTAAELLHGLRAALEIVAGGGPRDLEAEKRRAAWQLFFLVVPLVSTTFASFGRMFGDIGPESIGWVLIDEAGQASPQYAVGAIWRAQRVVAVGDPLQLQPVVTIPQKAQHDIAAAYGVLDTWMPPRASVQTLADRVSIHGTSLEHGDERVWVSAPLTVHRRCDDPMFSLCNQIAYNGIMVNGVTRRVDDPERPDLFDRASDARIAPSSWVDEPAPTPGSHLQENQIERVEKGIAYLIDQGVPAHEIIAISPFRAVADRLKSFEQRYPGLRAGTIHTAQGREASAVFLVLGGDPSSPGAKDWAASSVNLVNVAASRAKRRLYVIGDRASWSRHNYFHQLAGSLKKG